MLKNLQKRKLAGIVKMAKITFSFEDVNDGVSVNIESDVDLKNLKEHELTQAQQMGLRMIHSIQHEAQDEADCNDPECNCPHLSAQSANSNFVAPQ